MPARCSRRAAAAPALALTLALAAGHLPTATSEEVVLHGCVKSTRAAPNHIQEADDHRVFPYEGDRLLPAGEVVQRGTVKGFDIDVLDRVMEAASRASGGNTTYTYDLRVFSSATEAMYATRMGQCEFLPAIFAYSFREECLGDDPMGGCPGRADDGSITGSSVCCLDFTHVYCNSGMTLIFPMAQGKHSDLWNSIFTRAVGVHVVNGIFISGLLVQFGAHVVWVLERGVNPDIPHGYLAGIDEAMWWALATLTTVGYGDRTVVTSSGRLFAVIFMLMSVLVMAFFTSIITAELTTTTTQPKVLADLRDYTGMRVCTKGGSYGRFVQEQNPAVEVITGDGGSFYDCVDKLVAGEVDGVVHNWGEALHWLKFNKDAIGKFGAKIQQRTSFAYALPEHSKLTTYFNTVILELSSTDVEGLKDLVAKWWGDLQFYDKWISSDIVTTGNTAVEADNTVKVRWEWGIPLLVFTALASLPHFVALFRAHGIFSRDSLQEAHLLRMQDCTMRHNMFGMPEDVVKEQLEGWLGESVPKNVRLRKAAGRIMLNQKLSGGASQQPNAVVAYDGSESLSPNASSLEMSTP